MWRPLIDIWGRTSRKRQGHIYVDAFIARLIVFGTYIIEPGYILAFGLYCSTV
jgi:hypothetical protein